MKIRIRKAEFDDIPQMVEVDRTVWWDEAAFNERQLRSQIEIYPQAILVGEIKAHGGSWRIVGIFSGMRLSSQTAANFKSWAEATGDGYFTTYDPEGEIGFGANLSVLPEYERNGIGQKLVAHGVAIVVREGMRYALLGSRMPGLATHNKERELRGEHRIGGEEYVGLRDSRGRILDSELRFYLSQPFMELVRVAPDYFPDAESENYAVLVRWWNPLYKFHLGWIYRIPIFGKVVPRMLALLVRMAV